MVSDAPLIESLRKYIVDIDFKLSEMNEIIQAAKRKVMEVRRLIYLVCLSC